MIYLEFSFTVIPKKPGLEILLAELSQFSFETFIEEPNSIKAYVLEDNYNFDFKSSIIFNNPDFNVSYIRRRIKQENWNLKWEENFQPIKVSKDCIVRSSFHQIDKKCKYDLIINPKMSFGTGHHETTLLMLKKILQLNLNSKNVLDIGCGTGVLSILASKMGAKNVLAIDIDKWAYENTLENIGKNNCQNIKVVLDGFSAIGNNKFHVICANINRNVLLKELDIFHSVLFKNGLLLLSGFYVEENQMLINKALSNNFKLNQSLQENKWSLLQFIKK